MISMKIKQIDGALFEARRFIDRALLWRKVLKEDTTLEYGSKEGGATKRASMDLTRALVWIRNTK